MAVPSAIHNTNGDFGKRIGFARDMPRNVPAMNLPLETFHSADKTSFFKVTVSPSTVACACPGCHP
jgi:hypothetical protein